MQYACISLRCFLYVSDNIVFISSIFEFLLINSKKMCLKFKWSELMLKIRQIKNDLKWARCTHDRFDRNRITAISWVTNRNKLGVSPNPITRKIGKCGTIKKLSTNSRHYCAGNKKKRNRTCCKKWRFSWTFTRKVYCSIQSLLRISKQRWTLDS